MNTRHTATMVGHMAAMVVGVLLVLLVASGVAYGAHQIREGVDGLFPTTSHQ